MMNKPSCFTEDILLVVDEDDHVISTLGKKAAHLKSNRNMYPHRAFSVFLFNEYNELLIQKRSDKKVTFPHLWSNTCCSHPVDLPQERIERHHEGIKRAAVRRMQFEIGIESDFHDYILYEKILYRADADAIFEEFEVDSILLIKKHIDLKEAKKNMNMDEVADLAYISKHHLLEKHRDKKNFTPWFNLIIQHKIDELFTVAATLDTHQEPREIKVTRYI